MEITERNTRAFNLRGLTEHEFSAIQAALTGLSYRGNPNNRPHFPEYRDTAEKILAEMNLVLEPEAVPADEEPEEDSTERPTLPPPRSAEDPRPAVPTPAIMGDGVFRRRSN